MQKTESERVGKIIANFDWKKSHEFGSVYRGLAEVFWEDKTINDEDKKRWISIVLKKASKKLKKAEEREAVRGSTYWELGNLAYNLPVKYKTGTEDPEKAIEYFKKAINLYKKSEIEDGWRGGAYEHLATTQLALVNLYKGTEKEKIYLEKAYDSKLLALRDYKEFVKGEHSWLGKSILRLENELSEYELGTNKTVDRRYYQKRRLE